MDLCTVVSQRFIPQAINLIQSYKFNSFDKKVYLYYFNTEPGALKIFEELFPQQVIPIEVMPVCAHALEPRVFFYKVFAINDCLNNHSTEMIYSDSANCFIQPTSTLEEDLVDESLFLGYNHPKLTNKFWTSQECLGALAAPGAEIMTQYWAGFQVYRRTADNLRMVTEMYNLMLDPVIALPDTTVKYPNGPLKPCIEHRQDQSVFSILIHKHNRHQMHSPEKTLKYGDWQTIVEFDRSYRPDLSKRILAPRESKFGHFRFLNVK